MIMITVKKWTVTLIKHTSSICVLWLALIGCVVHFVNFLKLVEERDTSPPDKRKKNSDAVPYVTARRLTF